LSIAVFSQNAAVSAQTTLPCGTAVGSDGTVDETDLSKVALSANTAGVLIPITNATVDIRYDVVAVDGVFGGDSTTKNLRARFADNGPQSQVIVRLSRLNMFSGVISVLAEIDSNDYSPSKFAQTQGVGFNCQQAELDFQNNILRGGRTQENRRRGQSASARDHALWRRPLLTESTRLSVPSFFAGEGIKTPAIPASRALQRAEP
jgi:hypothetical protein